MNMKKDARMYVESSTPQEKHKHKGWFYKYPEKKFYRWNDFKDFFSENK